MSSFSPRRQGFVRLSAFVVAGMAVGLAALAAQPPEVEDPKAKPPAKKIVVEEEDPKGGAKKKIVVDEPDPKSPPGKAGAPAAGSPPEVKLDELARAAEEATHAQLKSLFARYTVPFDRLTDLKGQTFRIKPIPRSRAEGLPPQFGVSDLDGNNRPQEPRNVGANEVKRVDYFEELILGEADRLLKPAGKGGGPDGPTVDEGTAAAEKLLAAGLRYHDHARENNVRRGKGWDDVRNPLVERLRTVRLRALQRAVAAGDWARARPLGTKLMAAYPQDAAVAKEVAEARVAEATLLMQSKAYADQIKARELLDEFETRFPGGGGEPVRKIRRELAAEAARLFERARGFKSMGNLVDARTDIGRADALDPTIPGLRELKRELGSEYPVLYVGVRTFPERMSPVTARLDSEQQAVSLLFEGLLEEVPAGTGGARYRLGAALSFPRIVPNGRELPLRQSRRQADGLGGFDAHDVVETVKLLRTRPGSWAAAGLPWLEDLPAPAGAGSIRLAFRHSHPDPRTLLTFRLLPARWLTQHGKNVDDLEFAARPFGTGPYRIHTIPDANAPAARELVFVDNPGYGRWRDRAGLPHIREIRLVEASRLGDPVEEFRRGRLHMLPDLTPAELSRALTLGTVAQGKTAEVVTATTNRRVHILAVNHRRTPLQNKDLRKGLAMAIDREAILNDLFRKGPIQHRRLTAAMSGPFPPSSWATVKGLGGQTIPLLNRGEATARLQRYLASSGAVADLQLVYSTADAQAAAACEQIKRQVEGLFDDAGAAGRKLVLTLEPLAPREFIRRVEEEHRYDLAYMPFDYPDNWHPYGLAAFLDSSAAGRDGRNVTGYLSPGTNSDVEDRSLGGELAGLLEHQDFAGDIAPRATRIHKLFNDCTPFVPLWQLDRHMLVSSGLKVSLDDSANSVSPEVLDQTVLFQNVARWRLE